MADYLGRLDVVVLDELGYLPFAQSGRQLLFHLVSRLYEQTSVMSPPTWPSVNGHRSSATPK
jgi:DNA replication protein DnaC